MKKTNLKDLAQVLGVSLSTVSKALKDSYEIGIETKARVRAMAEKMNYRANPYAGHLHSQKSNTIAVIVPEITNNFFIQAISGIEAITKEKNYHLLIYVTNDDFKQEEKILEHLQNGRVDGIIMSITTGTKKYDHINQLIMTDISVIFFDRICHEIETAKITTDDFASAFNATEHLIQNGCKKISYLSISDSLSIDQKRKQGYFEALGKHEIPLSQSQVVTCDGDENDTYKKIKQLLNKKSRPDGIFASIEKLALITYYVCRELKISIPGDVKIICFSNLRTAPLLNPSLTTITQPAFEMGKQAATILFAYLNKKNYQMSNQNIVIKSELEVRESTQKNSISSSRKLTARKQ